MSATLPVMTDEAPTLEQRVAVLEAALESLMRTLVQRGDISINDVRAAWGLPEMSLEGEAP